MLTGPYFNTYLILQRFARFDTIFGEGGVVLSKPGAACWFHLEELYDYESARGGDFREAPSLNRKVINPDGLQKYVTPNLFSCLPKWGFTATLFCRMQVYLATAILDEGVRVGLQRRAEEDPENKGHYLKTAAYLQYYAKLWDILNVKVLSPRRSVSLVTILKLHIHTTLCCRPRSMAFTSASRGLHLSRGTTLTGSSDSSVASTTGSNGQRTSTRTRSVSRTTHTAPFRTTLDHLYVSVHCMWLGGESSIYFEGGLDIVNTAGGPLPIPVYPPRSPTPRRPPRQVRASWPGTE